MWTRSTFYSSRCSGTGRSPRSSPAGPTFARSELAPSPDRFEAGLQNYAGAVGAAAAARYVTDLGPANIKAVLFRLNVRATEAIGKLDGVDLIGPEDPARRCSILNFTVVGMRSEDLAILLNDAAGIMVRAGKHCVHSWFNARQAPDSVRVSFAPYNTMEEVTALIEHLGQILKHFVQGEGPWLVVGP